MIATQPNLKTPRVRFHAEAHFGETATVWMIRKSRKLGVGKIYAQFHSHAQFQDAWRSLTGRNLTAADFESRKRC